MLEGSKSWRRCCQLGVQIERKSPLHGQMQHPPTRLPPWDPSSIRTILFLFLQLWIFLFLSLPLHFSVRFSPRFSRSHLFLLIFFSLSLSLPRLPLVSHQLLWTWNVFIWKAILSHNQGNQQSLFWFMIGMLPIRSNPSLPPALIPGELACPILMLLSLLLEETSGTIMNILKHKDPESTFLYRTTKCPFLHLLDPQCSKGKQRHRIRPFSLTAISGWRLSILPYLGCGFELLNNIPRANVVSPWTRMGKMRLKKCGHVKPVCCNINEAALDRMTIGPPKLIWAQIGRDSPGPHYIFHLRTFNWKCWGLNLELPVG